MALQPLVRLVFARLLLLVEVERLLGERIKPIIWSGSGSRSRRRQQQVLVRCVLTWRQTCCNGSTDTRADSGRSQQLSTLRRAAEAASFAQSIGQAIPVRQHTRITGRPAIPLQLCLLRGVAHLVTDHPTVGHHIHMLLVAQLVVSLGRRLLLDQPLAARVDLIVAGLLLLGRIRW
uniref:Putative secreted protein n=1 Tax=Anopheles marajoara TaxID=58244 RepID=A0A2M4C645_9DIPT